MQKYFAEAEPLFLKPKDVKIMHAVGPELTHLLHGKTA